jgi:serine/threonine protein kinase
MIGTQLGTWVIDQEIGRGGMGCVYLAHRAAPAGEASDRAAVKVLAAELAVDPSFRERFRREIDILQKLEHPNIVRLLDSGEQGGRYYFAMEYVPGSNFETLREQRGRLAWSEVLDLALQVAPALKHAHDRGIIHRDLKPSNLLRVDADTPEGVGRVKLTDFGIASLFASPHLTATGAVVGTAEYLSPEQAAGKPATRRSDLYSLGVVLYTLLTGRTPFEGELLDLLHKHRFAQFDRPARLVPEVPHELDDLICQLLEKDPARRPADAGVLYRQLDSLRRKLERKGSSPPPSAAELSAEEGGSPAFVAGREGPATLASRLVRQELGPHRQQGPVRRFLNRPWVLAILLVATVGLIAWSFWPLGPEALFQRGAALMTSPDPDDWERAWRDYLGPLESKYPNNPHQAELEEFRRRREAYEEEHRAERSAAWAARRAGPMGEAQWFFQKGLRLRQQGDEEGARRVWRDLVAAFGKVPSAGPWVTRAQQELDRAPPDATVKRDLEPVRAAIEEARRLRAEGQAQEADRILEGLKELYRGDPTVEALLREK